MENIIKLKKNDLLKIKIQTDDGKDTGNFLYFDLEDIELPLKLNECYEMHKKNIQYLKMQVEIINKKQDKNGKELLSFNEKSKVKLMKEFYDREMKAIDLFIGKDGCKKLLNGRNPYLGMFEDFLGEDGVISNILPILEKNFGTIEDKIKSKYSKKGEEII